MARHSDSRNKAIETAERLFRVQGYAATGLAQIIADSGSPKGSFYFLFPGGKLELAQHVLRRYAAKVTSAIHQIAAQSGPDPKRFIQSLCAGFASETAASDFLLGCAVQNLTNEEIGYDPAISGILLESIESWQKEVARPLLVALDPEAAAATALALISALEGARTMSRIAKTTMPFDAVATLFDTVFTRAAHQ